MEVHRLGREKRTAIFWAVVLSEEITSRIDVDPPAAHALELHLPLIASPVDIPDVSFSQMELNELGIGTAAHRETV